MVSAPPCKRWFSKWWGNLTITNNQMDLDISGNGFFITQTSTRHGYARNGQFRWTKMAISSATATTLMGWGTGPGSNPVKIREGELETLVKRPAAIAPLASDGGASLLQKKITLTTPIWIRACAAIALVLGMAWNDATT